MTDPRCPLCGSDSQRHVFTERGHRLLQCGGCELFYIDPYPAASSDAYETVSDYRYEDLEIVDVERHYRSSTLHYQIYFPYLAPELKHATRVLDVGCGTGRLLHLLQEHGGISAVGLELNKQRAAYARTRFSGEVIEQPLEQYAPQEPFDVICLMNVLSHIPDLDPFFAAVRRLLVERGKLVMKVGEMTSQVHQRAVHDWSIPDHLHFLGMKSMDVLADKYGFEITRRVREPLSRELFAKETWKAPGRSSTRNVIKTVVSSVPFSLPVMSRVYDAIHGQSIFSSFYVLQKRASAGTR